MGALERAKGNLADIPLGETKLDPRTEKKRAAEMPSGEMNTTLSRILYDMRGKYDNSDTTDPTGGQQ